MPSSVTARRSSLAPLRLAIVDQPQPRERQQRVDLVDQLAERHDRSSQAAGRDRRRLVAQLIPQALHHPVDLPISARGGVRSILGIAAARLVSASIEISTPGAMIPPTYSPAAPTMSYVIAVPKSTMTHGPPSRS